MLQLLTEAETTLPPSAPANAQSEVLSNPRDYCEAYLAQQGIVVSERGQLVDKLGRDNLQIFKTMHLDYRTQVNAHNASERLKAANIRSLVNPIQESLLWDALNEQIDTKRREYRSNLFNSLSCVEEDLTPVQEFIAALTGKDESSSSFQDDVTVFAHWLWQVKRKMSGAPAYYHVMPVLYGTQGGGKTEALNSLIQPINSLRLNIGMDEVGDSRCFKGMSEHLVIVFDEMQGAGKADIDALKKQITTVENDYRPLGTNQMLKVRQSCSFIGATNRMVAEQIKDSTGMRRFWQIDCLPKLDWDVINNLDYIELWKGIDETKPKGYLIDRLASIQKKQEDLVHKDPIMSFVEENALQTSGPTKLVSVSSLYEHFKTWAEQAGYRAYDRGYFGQKLRALGFEGLQVKYKSKPVRTYKISAVAAAELRLEIIDNKAI